MIRQFDSDDPLKNALVGAAVAFAAIGAGGLLLGAERPANDFYWIAFYYYAVQDAGLAILLALVCALILARPAKQAAAPLPAGSWRAPAIAAAALFAACLAGRFILLGDYNLSRDEQLADYDAAIFASGALFAPAPAEWTPFAPALNNLYFLPTADGSLWVSNYLPVNAALRAIGVNTFGADIVSPLFVAIGALALWRVVRILWPEEPELIAPALLLYALSAQVLVHGMSSYAMAGHLALNLVWLWLFLKRRLWSDFGALGAGFLASGLHQPLFHPLFAAPILCFLIVNREWGRLGLYLAGYACVGVFWLSWPSIVLGAAGAAAGADASYGERIAMLLGAFDPSAIGLLFINLLRWLTWQHALFAPLIAIGALAAWRAGGVLRSLVICIALYPIVMLVLMPFQVHGWGYRHMHAVMGPAILVCIAGYRLVGPALRKKALIAASLATACVLIPVQLGMVSAHYRAYADLDRRIDASGADFALVDLRAESFAHAIIQNEPDLSNRPLRLAAQGLDAALLEQLCKSNPRVALVGHAEFSRIRALFAESKLRLLTEPTRIFAMAEASGCRTSPLAAP